ncbi:hypothetical protein HD554DRAFT_836714 [Boletus coccyginus]|nr:hypothetical protein HD554DRAFT_836714 [Boletus coccyginus]
MRAPMSFSEFVNEGGRERTRQRRNIKDCGPTARWFICCDWCALVSRTASRAWGPHEPLHVTFSADAQRFLTRHDSSFAFERLNSGFEIHNHIPMSGSNNQSTNLYNHYKNQLIYSYLFISFLYYLFTISCVGGLNPDKAKRFEADRCKRRYQSVMLIQIHSS